MRHAEGHLDAAVDEPAIALPLGASADLAAIEIIAGSEAVAHLKERARIEKVRAFNGSERLAIFLNHQALLQVQVAEAHQAVHFQVACLQTPALQVQLGALQKRRHADGDLPCQIEYVAGTRSGRRGKLAILRAGVDVEEGSSQDRKLVAGGQEILAALAQEKVAAFQRRLAAIVEPVARGKASARLSQGV